MIVDHDEELGPALSKHILEWELATTLYLLLTHSPLMSTSLAYTLVEDIPQVYFISTSLSYSG